MKPKLKVPKGKVGILVTVKVVDPEKKTGHGKMERFLAEECAKFLQIRLDPKLMGAFYDRR